MSSLSDLQEKLLEDNYRLVPFCVRKYFNPPYDDFEDYVQIGSIGLFKAVRSYQPESGLFSTYAAKCIRNELLHFLRVQSAQRRTPPRPLLYLDEKLTRDKEICLVDIIPDKNDMIGASITALTFKTAFENLTPREKEVFILYFHGKSQDGISAVLHISQPVVSKALKRARTKLQMALVS